MQVTLDMSTSLAERECPDPKGYISTTLTVIEVGIEFRKATGLSVPSRTLFEHSFPDDYVWQL